MIGGSIVVGLCLIVLGWTKEIVGNFVTEPDMVSDHTYSIQWTGSYQRIPGQVLYDCSGSALHLRRGLRHQCWSVICSFAKWIPKLMQSTVQASCRSLIVDTLPIAKQQLGSAWGKHGSLHQKRQMLNFYSKQDDCNWPSRWLWNWHCRPCQSLGTYAWRFSIQAIDSDCRCFLQCCGGPYCLGCPRARLDLIKVRLHCHYRVT